MPNPRLTVAELTASDCTASRPATNWNSTLMDQITADFMSAVCGPGAAAGKCDKAVVTQISTMPSYMYVGGWCPNASTSCLPANPYNTTLPNNLYVTGGPGQKFNPELVDGTCESMARYVARVVGCKMVILSRFVAVRLANPKKYHYFRVYGGRVRGRVRPQPQLRPALPMVGHGLPE